MMKLTPTAYGIAHKIKNPLNFKNNFSEIYNKLSKNLRKELFRININFKNQSKTIIDEILNDLEQDTENIHEHGKRVDSIIRGMLLHSRGEPGKKEEVDLNALLAEYTTFAYHGIRARDYYFKVDIETNFDTTINRVSIVPQDFSRAFLNVINNACYAVNEKKKKVNADFSPLISVSTRKLNEK
jgi:histidine kinase